MAQAKPEPLGPDDEALLDRLAARVVELRMEVAAILALESGRPLGFLASQAMVFFEPFARAIFPLPDYRRFASLLERRETVEQMITKIELRADAAARERKQAKADAAAGKRASGPQGRAT